jgi:beta-lactamase regulating signal transducer with metallopeptidase domain
MIGGRPSVRAKSRLGTRRHVGALALLLKGIFIMHPYETAAVWCAVQATVVAALALTACWLLARRSSAAAATAAASAGATILTLTFLAAAPRPAEPWMAWSHVSVSAAVAGDVGIAESDNTNAPASPDGAPGIAAAEMFAALRRLTLAAEEHALASSGIVRMALCVAALCSAVGVARLAAALWLVRRLLARSTPVVGEPTLRLFAELAVDLAPRRRVQLRESTALTSPAACGGRRAIVLLPVDRAAWSPAQLRAALAHELAHVGRRDFAWRLAASLAAAIHFWHPLVHALARRLALWQELAADRRAAPAAGGVDAYLRAISELALRWDDQSRRHAAPVVLPALSSNLMRRIAVLRSKDGSRDAGRGRLLGVAAAGLIALVGVATLAVGPVAEAVEAPAAADASAMFARTKFDPALAGHPEQGLFVFRVAELADQPAYRTLFQLTAMQLQQEWGGWFRGAEAPELRLDAVEYIAGAPTLSFRSNPNAAPGAQHQMMFGSGEQVIRFRHDVDWRAWLDKHMPGCEEVVDGDFTYVKLPNLPALGPERMCVAARDARTLFLTLNVDRLRALATGVELGSGKFDAAWKTLDGGIFTALIATWEIDAGFALPKPADPAGEGAPAYEAANVVFRVLSSHVKQVGAGVDLDPATNQLALRLRLACDDQASADQTREAVEVFLPVWRVALAASRAAGPQGPDDPDLHVIITPDNERAHREGHDFWLGLIDGCRVTCEPQDDGTTHVCITATATHPSTIVNSQAVAVADEEVERK